jgi:hypothetical protein
MNIAEPNDKVFKDIRYRNYGNLGDIVNEKLKFLADVIEGRNINNKKYDINVFGD